MSQNTGRLNMEVNEYSHQHIKTRYNGMNYEIASCLAMTARRKLRLNTGTGN